ncbi:bifunctional D-glycero-beta-D-manno-heptose-7-phosphate kinase/D-glycero-beta-D-manno-heptose 1-phosphate adenylyltransferase HldE [Alteromonadaceae bacterium BrNp21-10]|nr:bifunctional D-glycero-beta-D-manno-heptose-7-phosphate kinase/D-glycero-beta-D-manno-heptose 1-phosphate adenylyltransferase HldE [Alteromonadaceae bacterium BrNp21-10]
MQLPDFSRAHILVVGDIMLDRYWIGPTGRISPEAPVPVVKINNTEDRPGGAANVALNVAALGAQVTLMGLTGDDEAAETLSTQLGGLGITCDFVRLPGFETITKLRVISRNQQLIRLDFEQDFSAVDKNALNKNFAQQLEHVDAVILSDYAKGCLSDVQSLIQAAKHQNIPVIVDPKGHDFNKYRGASLLTPNMAEFSMVAKNVDTEQDIVDSAQKMAVQLGLDAMLITRSEKGMTLIRPQQPEFHLPAKAKEVYDVTGAGDTVIATLAAAFAAGAQWQDACALANAAAGVVVGKLGTSTVSINELALAVSQETEIGRGVMTEQQLHMAITAAKLRGEKVVMTNGCFDILHAGHVSYLQNAKKLGERLIVAVNSDASVRGLKGPGRPVNGVQRRMSVLAGLASVDWVFCFEEDTPQRVIAEMLPDILVKGGDYKAEDIAGSKEVWANGGEVLVLNFEDGVSTSAIIKSIKDND